MEKQEHYKALESMYLAAPINEYYQAKIKVQEGEATVTFDLKESMHHSAGAVHGSVYFKVLDDAAFFAANSLEKECFTLTASFNVYLTRPIVSGELQAIGKVVSKTKSQWVVEAIAYNNGKEVARGSGIFVRGKMKLAEAKGYSSVD